MGGRRRALVWTLIVLASLIALGSILTTWVHRQMLDNQSWKDASARLIENPEVQNAVSVYVVNELYDNVGCRVRARAAAARQPQAAGAIGGRRAAPARHERGQAAARGAARAAAVGRCQRAGATEARQRAREQDRPRDLH